MISRWKDVSISKKLYFVVGLMASLIVIELLMLSFAMENLSAVRAFVGGEGAWTKGQKQALYQLQRYALTRDERDYIAFKEALSVNEGDHIARLELMKEKPDMDVIHKAFLQGEVHPEDIEPMVKLIRRFHKISYLAEAIAAWTEGDALIDQLKVTAERYHALISSGQTDYQSLKVMTDEINELNGKLSIVTAEFSLVLGEGSRWLENLVFMILFALVLTVESVGLTLAFLTSRDISRGLKDVIGVSNRIGQGKFDQRLEVKSGDEIGQLTVAVNNMGELLQQSYSELEEKIAVRTQELANAVRVREDFMSVASHEIKTPLTILKLQSQLRERNIERGNMDFFTHDRLKAMFEEDDRQINRLTRLVDDMLDISRLRSGKFQLEKEEADLCKIAREVVIRFTPQFEAADMPITLNVCESAIGIWDVYRIEQVFTNLLTNAMKYGAGKPVEVSVTQEGKFARLSLTDHGIGVAPEDQARIFQQFERAVTSNSVTGLGLGLFIAQEIVHAHGGELSVTSQFGVGSTFTMDLPLA